MRAKLRIVALASLVLSGCAVAARAESEHRIGGGLHYWQALEDFASSGFDVEQEGLGFIASYQYLPGGLVSFELDVEYFPDGFGGADQSAFSPSLYLMVGRGLYGGLGAGVTVSSGLEDDVSDVYWAGRVGWNKELLPNIYLDLNFNYRAGSFDELEEADVDTDSITVAAQIKLGF